MNTPERPMPRRSRPVRAASRVLRRELGIALRHGLGGRRARRVNYFGQKLNVGCGKYSLPDWINADIVGRPDVVFDIRRHWPIESDQLDQVRLEHVLEHVGYPDEACHVLSECHRVLRPGGVVRVGVPDTAQVLLAYVEGADAEYFRIARSQWHPPEIRLAIEHVNFHFRDRYGEHLFAYDLDVLESVLSHAGFLEIQGAGYDPDLDRADREAGTIRLSGRKPRAKENLS